MNIKEYIKQPIEGLLYDLDLMPEQCNTSKSNLTSGVIKELQAENEKLKKVLEWYANKNHIAREKSMCGEEWEGFQNRCCYASIEDGKKARETLKDICKPNKDS